MPDLTASIDRDDWNRHWEDYSGAAERNPAQRYRRQIIGKLLARFGCGQKSRILDVGSGQGDLARDLRLMFPAAEIAGVELSSAGVDIARQKVPAARFFQRDLLESCQDPGTLRAWAEFAVCSEVLEHVDEPGLLLTNAAKYLTAGATLLVTVPGGPQSQFDRYIGHRRHYTPAMLRALLEANGFTVELATTAGFPFFNLYRAVVILRGKRLVTDVARSSSERSNLLASIAMAVFQVLFAFNLLGTRLGWQTIAIAKLVRPEGHLPEDLVTNQPS
jgi:2-polyprenyl-3-methyl-5-hydroxy-6-metoxy-1,4-benzoquinol methylase